MAMFDIFFFYPLVQSNPDDLIVENGLMKNERWKMLVELSLSSFSSST